MTNTISLRTPSIAESAQLAETVAESVARFVRFDEKEIGALTQALRALVEYVLVHAYPGDGEGELAVEFHLFDGGVRIDVHDWGLPLELERHRASEGGRLSGVPAELSGLDLSHLVDEVSFHNLGRDGKLFSLVKYGAHSSPTRAPAPLLSDHDDHEHPATALPHGELVVRAFQEGDEEGVCQLVYRNYAYTYKSDFFYYPEKLLERNLSGQIVSSVAELDGAIVGHHALLREKGSPISETGAAVVHPDYKGLGIFNALSVHTLSVARELGLAGVFGQAVTVHPYSQKTELAHGYRESALLLGKGSDRTRIERSQLTRGKRNALVVTHLLFDRRRRSLFLPAVYGELVTRTYARSEVPLDIRAAAEAAPARGAIATAFDAGLNVGFIAVPRWESGDELAFARAFHYLLAKHCDMIYADVNLETVAAVDELVELLNSEGFFYGGVLFLGRDGQDQLRLQYKNSLNVEEENIVCYSDFCAELRDFVLRDEQRVERSLAR